MYLYVISSGGFKFVPASEVHNPSHSLRFHRVQATSLGHPFLAPSLSHLGILIASNPDL